MDKTFAGCFTDSRSVHTLEAAGSFTEPQKTEIGAAQVSESTQVCKELPPTLNILFN